MAILYLGRDHARAFAGYHVGIYKWGEALHFDFLRIIMMTGAFKAIYPE
jgi:hypothetical protein